jgi:hypothetical protein
MMKGKEEIRIGNARKTRPRKTFLYERAPPGTNGTARPHIGRSRRSRSRRMVGCVFMAGT